MNIRSVLVIGAGVSGLAALKELVEAGFDCTAIEVAEDIGGVFRYGDGTGPAYDSTRLTVSNFLMAYSCLPPARGEPRWFWTHREYITYLRRFVERYDLERHIRFGVSASDVHTDGDTVRVTLGSAEGERHETFDAVVVCTGTHRVPKLPDLPGRETFTGEVLHSVDYRNADRFEGQRVVCVGLGETGADVAHEVAQRAAATLLSIRHYPSIIERFPFEGGHPGDAYSSRAAYLLDRPTLQAMVLRGRRRRFSRARQPADAIVHDWAIRSGGLYGQWFTKNSACMADIAEDRIAVNMAGIERLDGSEVVFRDGQRFAADAIICNTGYREQFPCTQARPHDMRALYKHMISPELGLRITFVGWARPELGGVPLCSELQARYLALLFRGERTLPEGPALDRLIAQDREAEEHYFHNAPDLSTAVPLRAFCDGLAELIGCHPFSALRATDVDLVRRLLFGPIDPSHYRLVGPGAQPATARQTIRRLPVLVGRREALDYLVKLGLRRLPGLKDLLPRLALQSARAQVALHVLRHGGAAIDPAGHQNLERAGARLLRAAPTSEMA